MWIDYDAAASGGSESRDFRVYWEGSLARHHNLLRFKWSIKDSTLIKRLTEEFSYEDFGKMVDRWHTKAAAELAPHFGIFYKERYMLFKKINPEEEKDYSW